MSSLPLISSDWRSAPVGEKLVVGVADLVVSGNSRAQVVTYALGSCLGVIAYDPVARVGGLLHVMLPDSTIDSAKAASQPHMFVDTGVPRLFREAYKLGAVKERMIVKVAGGAAVQSGSDMFEIGKRNLIALRKILWKNSVMVKAQDVGGSCSRTVTLDLSTGGVTLRIDGTDRPL
jgi:chemotaxis protein CheD